MRNNAAVVVLIISLLSFPVTRPVFADVFKDAADASGRGDDKTAFLLLMPLAEQGNARAQYILDSGAVDMFFLETIAAPSRET